MDALKLPDAHASKPVLVGFSGGLDSTVLLHRLAGSQAVRDNGLRAIHVHHGLHIDAEDWEAHCRATCDKLDVPLSVSRVEVETNSGDGPEGAARKARHAAFEAELHEGEVLALAHHQDDQAETFLLRALRASGPDGLAAMRPWRRFGSGWLWRPLLDEPRHALQSYAETHGLSWIDDPTNESTEFDRNFLRLRVLPLLRERWPHANAAFARAADLQAGTVALLDVEDARALASVRTLDANTLSVLALYAVPTTRRARVLRRWIEELSLPPLPATGITSIETDLLPADGESEARFEWSGARVQRWRDLLHADTTLASLPADWQAEWDPEAPLSLPGGGQLEFEASKAGQALESAITRLAPPLRVHARRGGERITLPGRNHSHALKHVLQELAVPPWERQRLPLVSDRNGDLLAAGDLVYASRFDAWLREAGARLVWSPLA